MPQPGWQRAFEDLSSEHGFVPLRMEGEVPSDLRGTLYRNGAARFSSGRERVGHWFDGHGGITAIRFDKGHALGASRLLRTATLAEDTRAGRPVAMGMGTPASSMLRHLAHLLLGLPVARNPSNTSVLCFHSRLLALCESGLPTEFRAEDLSTLSEDSLSGMIPATFSAHPHPVPERRTTYNFGVRYGKETLLDVFALPDSGDARLLASLPLPVPTMIHDFMATERHLIFLCPPLRLNILRMVLGLGTFVSNISWRPELGTEVVIVPLDAPDRPIRFQAEPFHQWHFANGFERKGELVLDLVKHADFSSNEWLMQVYQGGARSDAQGTLARVVIDPQKRRLRSEALWEQACEFPRVAPRDVARPYRYVYLSSHSQRGLRSVPDQLAKVDLESGKAISVSLGEEQYPSEPVFVPRAEQAADDDGYLLTLVYDARAHGSYLSALDARDIASGPLFRAHFDHHVPFTFHGIFVPS